jgi:peroxiredoxin Q/BCP
MMIAARQSKSDEEVFFMLAVGQQAPDFTLYDQNECAVQLSSLRGRKVILYFYPRDNTAGCTREACSFRDHYPAYEEKGAVVIGVSPDSSASHLRFAQKHALPFILLSDPDKTVIQAYGAWGEKKNYGKTYMGLIRSTFVINEEGVIERVFGKVNTVTHGQDVESVL